MTMTTLLGNPERSTNPITSTTLPPSCGKLPDPIFSPPTPQHHEMQNFDGNAGLRDIPTGIPTTAANPEADDDDDDDDRRHSSIITNDTTALTADVLQQWDSFYTDFLHSAQSYGVPTGTDESQLAYLPAVSPADDNPETQDVLSTLEYLSNELFHLLHSPRAPLTTNTANKTAPTTAKTVNDSNNNNRDAAERENNNHSNKIRSTDQDNDRSNADYSPASDRDTCVNKASTNEEHDNLRLNYRDDHDRDNTNHEHANRSIAAHDNDNSDNNASTPSVFDHNEYGDNNRHHNDNNNDAHSYGNRNPEDSTNDNSAKIDHDHVERNNTNSVNSSLVKENHNPHTNSDPSRQWHQPNTNPALLLDSPFRTGRKSHNNIPINDTAFVDGNEDDRLPPDQQISAITVTSTICTPAEWDTFYHEHVQFLQAWYPELLQRTPTVPNDEHLKDGDERLTNTDPSSAISTPANKFPTSDDIITASDANVIHSPDPPRDSSKHPAQTTASITEPQLHQCLNPTQQPLNSYCTTPSVDSGTMPTLILSKPAPVCPMIRSTTANQILGQFTTVPSTRSPDLRTQTLQKILALLDELHALTLRLLQLVSRLTTSITPPCNTYDPSTHLTQSQFDPIEKLPPISLSIPDPIWPMIVHPLPKVSFPTWIFFWLPPQPDMRYVPAPHTSHLKHVPYKTPATCNPGHMMSWPQEDMRPP